MNLYNFVRLSVTALTLFPSIIAHAKDIEPTLAVEHLNHEYQTHCIKPTALKVLRSHLKPMEKKSKSRECDPASWSTKVYNVRDQYYKNGDTTDTEFRSQSNTNELISNRLQLEDSNLTTVFFGTMRKQNLHDDKKEPIDILKGYEVMSNKKGAQ